MFYNVNKYMKSNINFLKALSVVLILSLFITVQSQAYYRKVTHNTDPEAKCLDGSPAALYIHEGT